MTGVGPVAVRCPRVRDRGGEGAKRIRFFSAILPRSWFRLRPMPQESSTSAAGVSSIRT
jgi:hypothetical protein